MIFSPLLYRLLWYCGFSLGFVAQATAYHADESKQQPEKSFGSIATQSEWLRSEPLEEWTQQKRFVENGVEHLVAGTAPFMTPADAESELDREMIRILREWIGERFSPQAAEQLELSPQMVRTQWMTNHRVATCVFQPPNVAPQDATSMYRSFAQVALTDKTVGQISNLWDSRKIELREARQRGTLIQWSILGGAILTLLASIHSYLRMDFVTRGYHTRKLRLVFLGTVAAIGGMTIWLLNILQ